MGKKRSKHQNPQAFFADDGDSAVSKKRSKAPKRHQKEEELISSVLSSKILKEALIQQREVQDEAEGKNANNLIFAEDKKYNDVLDEGDIDDFDGFSDTEVPYGLNELDVNEDDERILEFFVSNNAGPPSTLADAISKKIKENDANISSETQPKLDDAIIELYKGVGKLLSGYTAGKVPKALKFIPSLKSWEEVLYLTEPENWSPNAMYQVTRIFTSNISDDRVRGFYRLVLLPRVREDIRKNKRLHFALYQSLKKALYKPGAFYTGLLFPLCESGTCNLREAVIIGSIIEKCSIPAPKSCAALTWLCRMEYRGTTSYFIKLILDKKYALAYSAVNEVLNHFMRFLNNARTMPVIWHQSLLTFVQRYKEALTKGDKDKIRSLIGKQMHKLVTPEIHRELDSSSNRGEKGSGPMLISVINRRIEEDKFDIPEVPMEED